MTNSNIEIKYDHGKYIVYIDDRIVVVCNNLQECSEKLISYGVT